MSLKDNYIINQKNIYKNQQKIYVFTITLSQIRIRKKIYKRIRFISNHITYPIANNLRKHGITPHHFLKERQKYFLGKIIIDYEFTMSRKK